VVLAIGTKLAHVVATLALENDGPHAGTFVGASMKPRDELFWFHRPKIVLYVLHLVLFQVRSTF
jgi:mlo protein